MNTHNTGERIITALKRKIVTALVSSLLFAFIFSVAGGFDFSVNGFANMYYLNFMFAISYGLAASLFSDWISRKISKKTVTREIISLVFHCLFGSILLVMSLVSAISFFTVDRLLTRVKIGWATVIIALAAVVLVFVILLNK